MRALRRLVFASLVLAFFASRASGEPADGRIQDNSFLVEEAYNQEAGVVQHIGQFMRSREGGWVSSFTQEWPLESVRHQLSATLAYARVGEGGARGAGDVALNYRLQLVGDGEARLAVAPRVSLLLPTGDWRRGLGSGTWGWQINVPVSAVLSESWVAHANAGATWSPSARNERGDRADTSGWNAGASAIFGGSRIADLMVEMVYSRYRIVSAPDRTSGRASAYVSPGVRWAWNLRGGLQVVPGVAFPIGIGPSRGDRQVLLYLSFEHPFAAGSR